MSQAGKTKQVCKPSVEDAGGVIYSLEGGFIGAIVPTLEQVF